MKLAIVGSCSLKGNNKAYIIISYCIGKYNPDFIISGGAEGIDSMAIELAKGFDIPFIEYLPKNNRWEPNGFKERNLLIAKNCDRLVRIVDKKSKTYGSGWTRDRAKEFSKPTEEFII